MQGQVIHIFREGNVVADALANEVIESQQTKVYNHFMELPAKIRKQVNVDKMQIPNLRIKTRKIYI